MKAYYQAMTQHQFEQMMEFLHDEVEFIGPLAHFSGKTAVIEAARQLTQILKQITIRSEHAYGDEVMLAYDFEFTDPINHLRAACLMTVKEQRITQIELFYDARPFEHLSATIFNETQPEH